MNDGTEEVGGDIFDETIQRALIQRVMEERGIDDSVQINEFARKRLLHACETAKITLSERETTTIYVQDFFEGLDDPDFDVQLTTQDLEAMVEPLIEKGLSRIKKCTEKCPSRIRTNCVVPCNRWDGEYAYD